MSLKISKKDRPTHEAVWVNVASDGDGYRWWTDADTAAGLIALKREARLKVAPANNPRVRSILRKLEQDHQRFRQGGQLPPEVADRLWRKASSQGLLEDWEGITVDDAGDPSYSPHRGEKAMELDPAFENLVAEIALALARDREGALRAEGDLLGNASGGDSSGEPPSSSDS